MLRGERGLAVALDLAFWRGVRSAATPVEWERIARSSYSVLVYHRLAGQGKRGQERIDLAPERFRQQLDVLRRFGFRTLASPDVIRFHSEAQMSMPRRSVALTVDDGAADCLVPLRRHAGADVQLFVPTREVGGAAHWLSGEPLLTWAELRLLADEGITIGSHARHHRRLTEWRADALAAELTGARADLRERLETSSELLAYPYGDHDLAVRGAARAAGYLGAYTTRTGRNGAGTDSFCIRRVSVHADDGRLAVLWKCLTGEQLPVGWLRLRAMSRRVRDARGRL